MTTITTPNHTGIDPRTGYQYDYAAYNQPTVRPVPAGPTTAPRMDATHRMDSAPRMDQVRYWVGAGITAVIAALVSLIALVVAQGIVHVPVVLGGSSIHAAVYGVSAAGIALLAAALFDGMLQVAPRPLTYYSWLGGIVTVLATLLPFTSVGRPALADRARADELRGRCGHHLAGADRGQQRPPQRDVDVSRAVSGTAAPTPQRGPTPGPR